MRKLTVALCCSPSGGGRTAPRRVGSREDNRSRGGLLKESLRRWAVFRGAGPRSHRKRDARIQDHAGGDDADPGVLPAEHEIVPACLAKAVTLTSRSPVNFVSAHSPSRRKGTCRWCASIARCVHCAAMERGEACIQCQRSVSGLLSSDIGPGPWLARRHASRRRQSRREVRRMQSLGGRRGLQLGTEEGD